MKKRNFGSQQRSPHCCSSPSGTAPTGAERSRRWWLDGVGNWKQTLYRDYSGTDNLDERAMTNFNEYVYVDGDGLDYDDNGNLITYASKGYVWDAFNRLRRATDGVSTVATYVYDSDGRRLMKDLPGTTNDRAWALDGWKVVEQYEGGSTLAARQFVYGAFINEVLFADYDCNYDGVCDDLDTNDDRYYFHQNPIYSVVAVTHYFHPEELTDRYDYDPYGQYTLIDAGGNRTIEGQSAIDNCVTFTGHWFDKETGNYYMRCRIYEPKIGSFITRDMILSPDLYSYCNNNPILDLDIFGLDPYEMDLTDQQVFTYLHIYNDSEFGIDYFPNDPRLGLFGYSIFSDARIRSASKATNPAFGIDIPSSAYDSDERAAFNEIANGLCQQTAGGVGSCVKEAKDIAHVYRLAVEELRKEFIDKYGWVGRGMVGNSANWQHEEGATRARRKRNYYINRIAPGPLCYEWADKIIQKLGIYGGANLIWELKQTRPGTSREHNFVVVMTKNPDGSTGSCGKKLKLDPWKSAHAQVGTVNE